MMLARHRRLLPLLVLLLGALALAAGQVRAQPAPAVAVVQADGAIVPPLATYLTRAIADANREGAAAIVIELDTPGGLMSATDEIVRAILASEVPVVVWVAPSGARAASAGVFVTYAAHVAAMAPQTRIGAASPVAIGGDLDETSARKATNDAVAQIKGLADLRGRNAEWAESAVRDAVSATAEEALDQDVVDLIAPDLPSLLTAINGRTVETAAGPLTLATAGAAVAAVAPGWFEQLLMLLADPTIAYLLLSLGGLGLFLELSNPGATFPGVAGGIALLLGLYGLGTLPVNWAGVALIAFAFLLFVLDLFIPSFGTLTIGGLVSFVLGSSLLLGNAPPGIAIAPVVIWTMTALLVGLFLLLAVLAGRTVLRKPATGREGLVGAVGTVRRDLAPDGVVFVAGELWQATAADTADPLPVGAPVAVAAVDGLRLVVRRATAAESARAGVAILPAPGPTSVPAPADLT